MSAAYIRKYGRVAQEVRARDRRLSAEEARMFNRWKNSVNRRARAKRARFPPTRYMQQRLLKYALFLQRQLYDSRFVIDEFPLEECLDAEAAIMYQKLYPGERVPLRFQMAYDHVVDRMGRMLHIP